MLLFSFLLVFRGVGVYDYIDGSARLFHFVFLSLFRFLHFQPSLPLDGAQLYGQLFQLFGAEPPERHSGYPGIQKRPEIRQNEHFSNIDFRINRRPKSLPKVSDNTIDWERYIENRKSSVRCKVEHAFRIIKCQFGYRKTVYRGLKKNENRLYAMFACANLYSLAIAGRKLPTT